MQNKLSTPSAHWQLRLKQRNFQYKNRVQKRPALGSKSPCILETGKQPVRTDEKMYVLALFRAASPKRLNTRAAISRSLCGAFARSRRGSVAKGMMQNKPLQKETARARKLRESPTKKHYEGNQILIGCEPSIEATTRQVAKALAGAAQQAEPWIRCFSVRAECVGLVCLLALLCFASLRLLCLLR